MRLIRAALALLPLLLFAAFAPSTLAAGLAFVINSGGASISVVDMATQKELRRIPALREPHHWALTPGRQEPADRRHGRQRAAVPRSGDRRGAAAHALRRSVPVGVQPGRKFFVVNGLARNQVDVYDGASLQLLKRFPIAAMPSHLAYSPDSSMVYVSLQETDRLVAIDLKKMSILWNQPVGKTPAGVLWLNGKVLVADMGTDYLAEVDPADGHVLRHIVTGKGAHNLFLSPDGKILWVNNRVGGTTESLDAATLTPIRTYKIPGGPDDMAFAPDGQHLDHAALGGEGRGARSRDRRLPDDRCRPLAARHLPERRGAARHQGGVRSGALSHAGPVRPRRRLAAGTSADPAAVPVRLDGVGGHLVRLGVVRGVWRGAGGADLRAVRAAGALAPGRALAGPQGGGGGRVLHRAVARRYSAPVHLRIVLSHAR